MNGECSNKKLGEKLYAYEAGMLNDSEREEFELHLLECPYCTQKALDFQKAAKIIRRDEQLKQEVARMDESAKVTPVRPRSRSRVIGTILAVAATVVLLIVQPWRLEISTSDEAVAAPDRLAVLPFENLADSDDPARLGEIIPHLLITDLTASRYVSVVSSQHISDLRRASREELSGAFSEEEALEIARQAKAAWMLTGAIVQSEPNLIVTAQITDVATGEVIGSSRIDAEPDESLFSVIDCLTVEVKKELSLPLAALDEPDPAVADVTTHSPEAYYHYIEGLKARDMLYLEEARDHFQQAVAIDSTFAMAYYHLALLGRRDVLEKALVYSDQVSENERLYIRSLSALRTGDDSLATRLLLDLVDRYPDDKVGWYRLATLAWIEMDLDKAARYYKKALEIDPRYAVALNSLAYVYSEMGKPEKALATAEQYVELAPDQPNPYDTRAEMLARYGRIDDAIESLKKAIEIRPDFFNFASLFSLGRLYIYKGEYQKAHETFQKIAINGNKATRSFARTYMGLIPCYQGKFNEALEVLDDGIAADRMELATAGSEGAESYKLYIKAMIYAEQDRWDLVRQAGRQATGLQDSVEQPLFRCTYAQLMAEGGFVDEARMVTDILKKELDTGAAHGQSAYYFAEGGIRMANGDHEGAVESFRESVEGGQYYDTEYLLARAHLEAGHYNQAIEIFQRLDQNYSPQMRMVFAIWSVKTNYYLGLAYEAKGDYARASAYYEKFLDIWKDADPGIESMADARERLARLQG